MIAIPPQIEPRTCINATTCLKDLRVYYIPLKNNKFLSKLNVYCLESVKLICQIILVLIIQNSSNFKQIIFFCFVLRAHHIARQGGGGQNFKINCLWSSFLLKIFSEQVWLKNGETKIESRNLLGENSIYSIPFLYVVML